MYKPSEDERLTPFADGEVTEGPQTDDEIADEAFAEESTRRAQSIEKGVVDRRKAQLIRRLKQRRKYGKPVRGGTGKQQRTRRRRFS